MENTLQVFLLYAHEFETLISGSESEADLLPWTSEPESDKPFSLKFAATRGWLASADLLGIVKGHSARSSEYEVEISGQRGLRQELIE